MVFYCAKHKGKNKKFKTLIKKLQVLDEEIKAKMIAYYIQKVKYEHMAHVYEWVKQQKHMKDESFDSDDKLEFRMAVVGQMAKFLFKGVDNAILDIEFKKEQKAIEKAQKVENKHGIDSSMHGVKGKSTSSPAKKTHGGAKATNQMFNYVPLETALLHWKFAPAIIFDPSKREVQMMIKKATTVKSVDDIEMDPIKILKGTT